MDPLFSTQYSMTYLTHILTLSILKPAPWSSYYSHFISGEIEALKESFVKHHWDSTAGLPDSKAPPLAHSPGCLLHRAVLPARWGWVRRQGNSEGWAPSNEKTGPEVFVRAYVAKIQLL